MHPTGVDWLKFQEAATVWQPNELNLEDLRRAASFLYFQGSRPLLRSDPLAAALTALQIVEGIYSDVLASARAAAEASAARGADGGSDHADRGSSGRAGGA